MATKSDFAQKLLHDLRLRKERMGVSQGSARNNATARDAYRDPGNLQRGSQQAKSLKSMGGSKSTNHQLISSKRSDQALAIKETSQQIVPYAGKHHARSETMGDLSMAFTYAVKNGINLMNMDFSSTSSNTNTMIDFLNQIGRRSLDGNARTGTTTSLVNHRPALTTIQIKEISKGVQNLYEIIRSSSNGTNVNRYSMEVGKELLKGAKGLEESLRMLVNLQEASELMVNTKRKSRITLLEVDGEDEENERSKIVDRNQVALPRFSFDKPSKRSNSQFIDGCGKVPTHRRSVSCDAESVRSGSSAKPGSVRSEKGRISNVIAKLMGLEEVPVKVDSCSRREEIKKVDDSSTNTRAKDAIIRAKVDSYSRQDEIKKPDHVSHTIKDGVIKKKMESYSKRDEIKIGEDLNKNTVKKTSRPLKDVIVSLNDQKPQQTHDLNANQESRMNRSNSESKEKTNSKRRSPDSVANPQVEKKKTVRKEKSNEIKLVPRNNQVQEPERGTEKIKQASQQLKPVKNTNSGSKELNPQPFDGKQNVKDSTPKIEKQERTQEMVPVTRKKVDSMAEGRTESPRAKDELLRRRNRTVNSLSTPSKHKLSVMKEAKRNEVHIRSEPEVINTKRSSSIVISSNEKKKTESTNRLHDIVSICENEAKSNPHIRSQTVVDDNKQTDISNKIVVAEQPICKNEAKSDPQITSEIVVAKVTICENEAKSGPQITSEIVVPGNKQTNIPNKIVAAGNISENKPKKAFYSSIQVVLTEQEKQLKEILIKDQLFLSTTEALFKLNIPVGFLHVDDHNNHHENETKSKLDCAYEILKRKARFQELSVHPYAKPFVADTSIRFLDELVKQLYKDFESLRSYGRDTHNEYDEADYLHHMLEKDIHNINPDVNSFWDFGWNITSFTFVEKDEFVKDVEQDMIHRLVDEIVDELLRM
ncbi:hypothetical protein SSX86_000061 [Deinandra increscens subsp. villosa]|uniref:DUF3741 domain-containing protein n=1 Tax=Deinandra increscens subsp. villosa TaxID=3103831 RepID=A0AAP0E067_9ASTR